MNQTFHWNKGHILQDYQTKSNMWHKSGFKKQRPHLMHFAIKSIGSILPKLKSKEFTLKLGEPIRIWNIKYMSIR